MKVVSVKTFSKRVSIKDWYPSIGNLDSEVNEFLATLPMSDVLDVRHSSPAINPYSSSVVMTATVLYLKEVE